MCGGIDTIVRHGVPLFEGGSFGWRVQYVVLDEEDNVIEDRQDREGEFYGIEGTVSDDGAAVPYGFNYQLKEGEKAPAEVQGNIPDAPPGGRLITIVQIDLRGILNESDSGLAVATHVDDCATRGHLVAGQLEDQKDGEDCVLCEQKEDDPEFKSFIISAFLIDQALDQLCDAHENPMD